MAPRDRQQPKAEFPFLSCHLASRPPLPPSISGPYFFAFLLPSPPKLPAYNRLQGQRVLITLASGAEFEGIYASGPSNPSSCYLRMVQQKKAPGDITNGTSRQEQSNMSFQKKDIAAARVLPSHAGKAEGKTPNGARLPTLYVIRRLTSTKEAERDSVRTRLYLTLGPAANVP